jgi:hypothetical protein
MSENKLDLQAIRKRAEATSFETAYVKGDPWKGYEVKDEGNGIAIAETLTKADAEFIAHARQDVPELLDIIAEKDAEIERLKEAIELAKFFWKNKGVRY